MRLKRELFSHFLTVNRNNVHNLYFLLEFYSFELKLVVEAFLKLRVFPLTFFTTVHNCYCLTIDDSALREVIVCIFCAVLMTINLKLTNDSIRINISII